MLSLKSMNTVTRDLTTENDVTKFFEQVGIYEELENDSHFKQQLIDFIDNKCPGFSKTHTENEDYVGKLAEIISKAEEELEKLGSNNTLNNHTLRALGFRTETIRKKYRRQVLDSCLSKTILDNDDNITLENGGMVPVNGDLIQGKQVVLIVGGPASGKSGYATLLANKLGAYLIDSDFIKRKLPEFHNENCIGASLVHEESTNIQQVIMNKVLSSGRNIVSPIVGKNYGKLRDLINKYEEKGYKVSMILISIGRLAATMRGIKRFVKTKRYVRLSYILDECGHEPVAAFYRIAAEDRNRSMIAIDNTDKENRFIGKLEFEQNSKEICEIIKEKIEDARIVKTDNN